MGELQPKKKKQETKYEQLVLPRLTQIGEWAATGSTDNEIAKAIGITAQTFKTYLNKYEELREQVERRFTAIKEVENSLYQKAMGKIVVLNKPLKVKKVTYSETGRKLSEEEKIEMVEEEVYFPPETSAIKFFLTNMDAEKWKNNRDDESTDTQISVIFGEGSEEFGD